MKFLHLAKGKFVCFHRRRRTTIVIIFIISTARAAGGCVFLFQCLDATINFYTRLHYNVNIIAPFNSTNALRKVNKTKGILTTSQNNFNTNENGAHSIVEIRCVASVGNM